MLINSKLYKKIIVIVKCSGHIRIWSRRRNVFNTHTESGDVLSLAQVLMIVGHPAEWGFNIWHLYELTCRTRSWENPHEHDIYISNMKQETSSFNRGFWPHPVIFASGEQCSARSESNTELVNRQNWYHEKHILWFPSKNQRIHRSHEDKTNQMKNTDAVKLDSCSDRVTEAGMHCIVRLMRNGVNMTVMLLFNKLS